MKATILLLLVFSFFNQATAQFPDAATIKKHKITIIAASGEGGTEYHLFDENGYLVKQDYEDKTFANPNKANQIYYNSYNKPDSIISKGEYRNEKQYFFYDADGKYKVVYMNSEYANGDADTSWYTKDNKIIRSKDAYGRTVKYDYNAKGQLIKSTESGTEEEGKTITNYTYNALGKLIIETRKDNEGGSSTKYEYNKQGLLVKEIRSSGWTTHYSYTFK